MSNLVIVAIPDENDRVWKVSSEKVPHMTLLFLGDVEKVANLETIMQFVGHATNTSLRRFYMTVDRRGELGADKADVLFFKKGRYDYRAIRDFRAQLLQDNNIKTAYDGATQFEGPWNPHLTLGYPASPAKPDNTDRDYGFFDVGFNKIAVWTGDFDGPEFLIKDYWDEWDALETVPMDVAMSALEHHGVKGMRWGVRKEDVTGVAKSVGKGAGSVAKAVGKGVDNTLFELSANNQPTLSKIAGGAKKKLKADLPGIKSQHGDYGKLKNRAKKPLSKEARAYRKDVKTAYVKHLETSANEITNISGSRRYTLTENGAPNTSKYYWSVSTEKNPAKHAATTSDELFRVVPTFDNEGYIVDVSDPEFPKNEMAQTVDLGSEFVTSILGDDSLEHYGVKGMRWGQRRASAVTTQTHLDTGLFKRQTKVRATGGEAHAAHDDAVKAAVQKQKLKKSGTDALSTQELRELSNRLQVENQVSILLSSKGKKFVQGQLEAEGKQALKKGAKKAAPHVIKRAGKAAATTAATVALL